VAGRQQERVRKRITADVFIADKQLKGLVVDISVGGLFVQMEAATLPARGSRSSCISPRAPSAPP
jgi:hypothetical protein